MLSNVDFMQSLLHVGQTAFHVADDLKMKKLLDVQPSQVITLMICLDTCHHYLH